MKKILIIMFLLTLLMGCSKQETELELIEKKVEKKETTTESQINENVEKEPLKLLTKEDVLEIWVRADGPPGMLLNEDGELEGFYVDLEKAVMEEMGQNYRLNSYTDAGIAVQKIRDGEAHNALATPILPDYKTFLNFSVQFEELFYVIFLQSHSNVEIPDNKAEAIKTLYGKKIGVQTRGHIYQVLRDHKEIEIVEYPTTTVAMEALNRGEVDAVPEVKRVGLYNSKKFNWNVKPVGVPIFSLPIGTSFSKTLDQSVVDRYNLALQTLIDNGYVAELYNSYFGE